MIYKQSANPNFSRRDRVVKQAFQCRKALELYAFGMLRDRAAAEDVVQDAFLVVLKKYESFTEGTSIMAWTRAIVRNLVLQQLDRQKSQQAIEDRMLASAIDPVFELFDNSSFADAFHSRFGNLERCLQELDERARVLLVCVYSEGMSYASAGEAMGMSVEAVRKNLYRSKKLLRSSMRSIQNV